MYPQVTWSRLSRVSGAVGGELAVDSRVEFAVTVQSQHEPAATFHERHAARPEPLSAVVCHVVS